MAIASEVAVYNLALNAVGTRSNVSSPTENSREAEVCRLWFSPVRDAVLAGAIWPEATEIRYLSLIREADEDDDGEWAYEDPRPGYSYVYALPSDMLRPQYVTDFSRFLISSHSDDRRVLHSNAASLALVYTKRLTNISLWNPELQMAIVYGLAANICMPLSGKPSRAKMLLQQANDLIMQARVTAANTSAEFHESIPDWITARGASYATTQRFYYPYGSLLSLTNVG